MSRQIRGTQKDTHDPLTFVANIYQGYWGPWYCEFHNTYDRISSVTTWPTEKQAREAARTAMKVLDCEITSDVSTDY